MWEEIQKKHHEKSVLKKLIEIYCKIIIFRNCLISRFLRDLHILFVFIWHLYIIDIII